LGARATIEKEIQRSSPEGRKRKSKIAGEKKRGAQKGDNEGRGGGG